MSCTGVDQRGSPVRNPTTQTQPKTPLLPQWTYPPRGHNIGVPHSENVPPNQILVLRRFTRAHHKATYCFWFNVAAKQKPNSVWSQALYSRQVYKLTLTRLRSLPAPDIEAHQQHGGGFGDGARVGKTRWLNILMSTA